MKYFKKYIRLSILSLLLAACGSSSNAEVGSSTGGEPAENPQDVAASDLLYFTGVEKSPKGELGPCYLELDYTDDLSQVTVRAVAPHPHESTAAAIVNLAMGPMVATYNSSAKIYRFQDNTDAAAVKDMVLYVEPQQNPSKYGALILHGNHHDPLFCEAVVPVTEPAALNNIKTIFDNFDSIKQQNP